MESLEKLSDWFWNEQFWLPPNATWEILEKARRDGLYIARPKDMFIPFPIAVCLFIIRLLWERFIAQPVGRYYKVREKPPRTPEQVELLETAYRKSRIIPSHSDLTVLAKKIDWEVRRVERWWRLRRVKGKPSEMQRFKETSWRFIFYFFIFYFGVYVMWDKPWLWDTKHNWIGYPKQSVPSSIYWYYMIELGFYYSLVMSIFMDNRRKDFWEMMIHHAATIFLMVLSWSVNMVRVGSLVLVVHDAVDYWLEGAKLCKYMQYHKVTDMCFVVFTLLWFVTRLVIYPYMVLNTTWFESRQMVGDFPSFYIFNALLSVLQVLHVVWFYMIMKMVVTFIRQGGQIEKDDRSDSEPEPSSQEEVEDEDEKTGKEMNGNAIRFRSGQGDSAEQAVQNGHLKKHQ